MHKITRAYRAGRTRRWAVNPDLAETQDPVDAHSGRVARIIYALEPSASERLLKAALTHDDGEHATGDLAAPMKRRAPPALMHAFETMEAEARAEIWGLPPELTNREALLLLFADRIDALIWAAHKAPQSVTPEGYAFAWLRDTAHELGHKDDLDAIFADLQIGQNNAHLAALGPAHRREIIEA